MSGAWSLFDKATGLFVGRQFSGSVADLPANVPPELGAIDGQHDHRNRRVDLATGRVVDWTPPPPADTWDCRHAWDEDSRLWVPEPTPAAIERARQARIKAEMLTVEAQQARPTRELVLDPQNRTALARLQALDRQLDALRAALASPPP